MTGEGIRSDHVVDALVRGGFAIVRQNAAGTILERGIRAVVVPTDRTLSALDVAALRRMAGMRYAELLSLLRRPQ